MKKIVANSPKLPGTTLNYWSRAVERDIKRGGEPGTLRRAERVAPALTELWSMCGMQITIISCQVS